MNNSQEYAHRSGPSQLVFENGQLVFDELLRTRLDCFIAKTFQHLNDEANLEINWLVSTMAWHLNEVSRGNLLRLIINVPPRHLKSISTSVAFPAFLLGSHPGTTITLVCYSNELGEKMMRDLRSIMTSEWYKRVFSKVRLTKSSSSEIVTDRNGGVNMTSIGGTLTGRGSDIIIVDDPIKPVDVHSDAERKKTNEWFSNTLFSRLNDKKTGRIIVAMQRLHEDDVTGHLTAEDNHGWTILKVPAIADTDERYPQLGKAALHTRLAGCVIDPAREDHATLARLKGELGSALFSAQYQQEPVPRAGNLVRIEWFRHYASHEVPEAFDRIVCSWDTASAASDQNDYSVSTVWGSKGGYHYLLDVRRVRLEYPALKRYVVKLANDYDADLVLLEKADSGRHLYDDLKLSDRGHRYKSVVPRGNKEDRVASVSALIEAGQVILPTNGPWLAAFLNEIAGFPNTRFDDQVDSFSQYLTYVGRGHRRGQYTAEGRRVITHRRRITDRRRY